MAADSINPMVNIVSLFWQVTCVGASSWAQYRNPSIAPPGIATVLAAVVTRPDGTLVAAEGVGTRAQLEFLDVRGCHCFQGFWVSKPLPAAEFVEFVKKRPS